MLRQEVMTRMPTSFQQCLDDMKVVYDKNPTAAVRGQEFIKMLHSRLADDLRSRIRPAMKKKGIQVIEEAKLYGSHKPKDVDVAVVAPINGPLMVIGVRSQMSSIGNNVLTYYQDIVGECISLQDRFPMATFGYAYLHPLIDPKKKGDLDHTRYARMYNAITGRDDRTYADQRGLYDQFAYLVVDFAAATTVLRDDIVQNALPTGIDMSIDTFLDRMIATFKTRQIWLDVFL